MIAMTPSVAESLANLAKQGIELQLVGGAIRFRPQHLMTPALLERLQGHKAELLLLLDTDNAVAELRRLVDCMWQDEAWRNRWEDRFREAKYANLDSLRRVLASVINLAAEHHRRQDWSAFVSMCRYLHRLALGDEWDNAEPIRDESRWKI